MWGPIPTHGTLWVRYLGGQTVYQAVRFTIPTTQVPDMVEKLFARGDVAQVWYLAQDEWDPKKAFEHKKS